MVKVAVNESTSRCEAKRAPETDGKEKRTETKKQNNSFKQKTGNDTPQQLAGSAAESKGPKKRLYSMQCEDIPPSKSKKIIKTLEALSQEDEFQRLEQELKSSRQVLSEPSPLSDINTEQTIVQPVNSTDTAEVFRQSSEILFSNPLDEPSKENARNALCSGCTGVNERLDSIQQSINTLWNYFHSFQQRLNSGYFYTSPYGATSSPVGFTQTTSFQSYLETLNSNDDSVIAMDTFTSPVVPQVQLPHSQPQQLHQSQSQLLGKKTADDSATVASAQTATSDKSATSGVSTPQSKQPCSSNSQTELAEQPTNARFSRLQTDLTFNGYTVEQLECAARRKKNFSKAAKHLLHPMFTDDERSGRCVAAFEKNFGGTTVSKEGLADQEKLAVLQDIILKIYPVYDGKDLTRTEINRRLSEKLKPSAH